MHTLLLIVFILGYLAIVFEHKIHVNKAATALFMGVVCWTIYVLDVQHLLDPALIPEWFVQEAQHEDPGNIPRLFAIEHQHLMQTGEISSILFFLMGAMTIVELLDSHEAFELITSRIRTRSKRSLLWAIGLLTFFMSAVLDNLTTTIVMVSLLKKLVDNREDRLKLIGLVVISANAGGAWTVIGDVTTTMLWIKHKIGAVAVMKVLFVGSFVSFLIPAIGFSIGMPGTWKTVQQEGKIASDIQPWHQWVFLLLGLLGLLSVPVFKTYTHLPPFMGMMLSLSVLWFVSEYIGQSFDDHTRTTTGVLPALKKVDMSSILFFLGILLAVSSLGATGMLHAVAQWLDNTIPNRDVVAVIIGLISSVVDNVPLVAAGIEMYDLPTDHSFWMMLAYCAGTGGSCLIIGSAAGVAAMGLERIEFLWYMRKIGPYALAGYLAGAIVVAATLYAF